MKKSIIYSAVILAAISLGYFSTSLISYASSPDNTSKIYESDTELMPTTEIDNYKKGENLYVDLNNELSAAINDYIKGKISKKEYLSICSKIKKQTDTTSEMKKLENAEKKYEKNLN